MFTLPPRPPKDHIIKDVNSQQASAPEFTPYGFPRVTQTTLGKFSYPVDASDDDPPDASQIQEVNPKVLEKWTKNARAEWVDNPEKNAFFLHEMQKNYSVVVDPSYDPRYKNRPRVFQRSYKYELDCLKDARLQKLDDKCHAEAQEEAKQQEALALQEKAKEKPLIELVPCKWEPPIWYRTNSGSPQVILPGARISKDMKPLPVKSTYQVSYLRWQYEPSPGTANHLTPCQRRDALALFGQPFMHEACKWYLEHYPAPKLIFRPEKFS